MTVRRLAALACCIGAAATWPLLARGQLGVPTGNLCAALSDCNAHGRCDALTKTCACFEGYGADTDIASYRSPDCSLRTCPAGPSWGGIPTSATTSHANAECSDAGVCDRSSGTCMCYYGYEGSACQRSSCPNGCSGHGQCLSMRDLAAQTGAFPLSPATTYGGDVTATTWDQDRIQGCLCDSYWPVGLGAGESQLSQWFGPDCSRMHCPSGDDPMTAVDETDCGGVVPAGGLVPGATGNLCHVDCANRGICDFSSGECSCFSGFYGSNCASLSPLA
ncbi:Teneurin-1 [Phytophthora cinnamomi]|uniref:Teneurin-1 n=1 Tax=Phytophthora cinnamomi TaxID=4785 RepID=UPI00355A60F4|nr:Teneurin-1 [Phytophthora cinnamomi]